MSNYFNVFSSMRNITTSAIDTSVKNAYTLSQNNEKQWILTGPGGKYCKVVIDCADAQKLLDTLKDAINKSTSDYGNSINNLITEIQQSIKDLKIDNIDTFINNFKKYQDNYTKFKSFKDAALKKPIESKIPVKVFVKGVQGEQKGKIKTINIVNKSVDIEYSFKKANVGTTNEKLYNILIKDICILGENCTIDQESKTKTETPTSLNTSITSDVNIPQNIQVSETSIPTPNITQQSNQTGGTRYKKRRDENDGNYKYICD